MVLYVSNKRKLQFSLLIPRHMSSNAGHENMVMYQATRHDRSFQVYDFLYCSQAPSVLVRQIPPGF